MISTIGLPFTTYRAAFHYLVRGYSGLVGLPPPLSIGGLSDSENKELEVKDAEKDILEKEKTKINMLMLISILENPSVPLVTL